MRLQGWAARRSGGSSKEPSFPYEAKRHSSEEGLPRKKAYGIAASLAADAWQTITWCEGSYGPLSKQFALNRAYRANQKGTGTLGWLVHERPLDGEEGDCKWYFSNPGEDAEPERLVELAHRRHEIERLYQAAKNELPSDHHEGRPWHGLRHHLTVVMWVRSWLAVKRRRRIERITDTDLPTNAPGAAGLFPLQALGTVWRQSGAAS